MNAYEPPQAGASEAPPAPAVVQQTTVIQVGSEKSVGLAVLLAFLFGPLGMLYATVPGAIVMFFVNVIVAIVTLGLGLFLTLPIGILWAGLAASSKNKRLQAISAQQVMGGEATPAPAPAPHSTPPVASPAAPLTTPSLPAVPGSAANTTRQADEGEVTVTLKSAASTEAGCPTCGAEVSAGAKFCSSCGAAQATA